MYLHSWYSRRFLWKYKAYETQGSGCGRDREMVRWSGQEGMISDINGGLHMASLDDGRTVDSFSESDLEKAW